MILLARDVGLEVSLAPIGMLEDLLLKACLIGRCEGEGKSSSRSAFSSRSGTSVGNNVAFHCVYSLPFITESTQSEQVEMGSQEPCSNRQADEAFSSGPVAYEKSGTDSLKTLKETKADLVKKVKTRSGDPEEAVQIRLRCVEKRALGTTLLKRC